MNLVQELNVEKTFIFLGKKENPYPYMKKANYIALLSYYEGYGMVIEEAKILNKPVVITDTAAKEAVRGYDRSLILKNDEDSIFEGLKKLYTGKYSFLNKNSSYNYDNKYILEEIKKILWNCQY